MHRRIRKFISAELVGGLDGPVFLLSASPLHEDGDGAGGGDGGSGDAGAGAGAGDGDGDGGEGDGSGDGGGDDGDGSAGDDGNKKYGQKYVERLRREAANARTEAKQAKDRAAELERANQTEQERALAEARDEGKKEASAAGNKRIVNATVRALAAGKWADPADATKYLDLSKYEVNDDGEVDEKQVADDLDKVLEDKPYLRVTTESGRPPRGSADGGARGGNNNRPKTLEEAAAASMTQGQRRRTQ